MKCILPLLLFTCALSSAGQNRLNRPIEIQLNLSGAFLAGFGQAISDPEIEEFIVTDWVLPGISAGYHFNRNIFAGLSITPNRRIEMHEPWGLPRV